MNNTLLIELLTEELPPKALSKLNDAFTASIMKGLTSHNFLEVDAVATSYATPRRLAISVTNVRERSPDQSIREKILPISVALDAHGKATIPLTKKLAALGFGHVKVEDLERAADGKADSLFYTHTAQGEQLHQALQIILDEAITQLPIPKLMSYQRPDGSTVQFVRPVHSMIVMHGTHIIPLKKFGLTGHNTTQGHRFLSKDKITIDHADKYASQLKEQGKVIANFSERKEYIRTALNAQANGDQVLMPEVLLDEVTALVEWPVVYACHFEEEFLTVPQECLVLTMQTNQKYFALTNQHGKLRSRFLIVSNIETNTPENIIQGNERVIRPRLSDAQFFFSQDKKKTLAARVPMLANVVYHNKLGSQQERTMRVQHLAGFIAQALHASDEEIILAKRAALLAKTDLLTEMVGEFPELQGIMGTYYARHDNEDEQVGKAISEHYQPRFAGDALPTTNAGTIVALADKIETIVGIWGIGLAPTGDKDPFALRRHTLGVLRILLEKKLPLSISTLLFHANNLFSTNTHFQAAAKDITLFMMDRLRGILRDRNFMPNEIEAVVAHSPDTLDTIIARLEAVNTFAALPESGVLAAANKRISNILKKIETVPGTVQPTLFNEAAEQALYDVMLQIQPDAEQAFIAGDFTNTLKVLAQLREPVDAFFNTVMVMDDNLNLRNNRIALLSDLQKMMNRVADISKLAS